MRRCAKEEVAGSLAVRGRRQLRFVCEVGDVGHNEPSAIAIKFSDL